MMLSSRFLIRVNIVRLKVGCSVLYLSVKYAWNEKYQIIKSLLFVYLCCHASPPRMRDQSVRPVLLRRWQVWVALLLPSLLVNSAQNSTNGGPAYIIHIQSVDVDIKPATETGGTCKAGAEGTECVDCRNNPRTRCMCGNVFLNNQTAEELNETVVECNSLLNDHSFLTREPQDPLSIGFCKDVLNDLNYTVNVSVNEFMVAPSSRVASGEECPGNETTSIVTLTEEQLNATIVSMQDKLTQFIEMLNRTIVGVYLRAAEQRCTCMVSFWNRDLASL